MGKKPRRQTAHMLSLNLSMATRFTKNCFPTPFTTTNRAVSSILQMSPFSIHALLASCLNGARPLLTHCWRVHLSTAAGPGESWMHSKTSSTTFQRRATALKALLAMRTSRRVRTGRQRNGSRYAPPQTPTIEVSARGCRRDNELYWL